MKNILYIILIGFNILACNNKKERDFKNIITNEKYFWSLKIIDNGKSTYLGQNFIFQSKKTYLLYQSFKDTDLGTSYFDLHTDNRMYWDYNNDGEFKLREDDYNFTYNVIKYNKDTIWLKKKQYNYIMTKHFIDSTIKKNDIQ